MNINTKTLMSAYEEAHTLVNHAPEVAQNFFKPVANAFEEKKRNPDFCIMVYGVYNAGKSTLINALMGRDEAPMGDVPLTSEVHGYQWKNYRILDTPGVDAPIAHEEVTREQMQKADVVIFVVNPLGVAEERKTLDVLVDLIEQKKQVFIVFNDKNSLDPEACEILKTQLRQRVQELAAARGLTGILSQAPIVKVNAKSALKAKLEGKSNLLEASGFPYLEQQLDAFLRSIPQNEMYVRLKHQLVGFLEGQVTQLQDAYSPGAGTQKFDAMMEKITAAKNDISTRMTAEIAEQKDELAKKIKRQLLANPEEAQPAIESAVLQAQSYVMQQQDNMIQDFVLLVQPDLDDFEASMPALQAMPVNVDGSAVVNAGAVEGGSIAPMPASSLNLPVEQITNQVLSSIKSEHVVSALKLTKEYLPTMMKGIGPVTMDKMADTVISKLPYIGHAVTLLMAAKDFFSEDAETKAMREAFEREQQAAERARQAAEDISQEVANNFQRHTSVVAAKATNELFGDLIRRVSQIRNSFSEQERQHSEQLQLWVSVLQMTKSS